MQRSRCVHLRARSCRRSPPGCRGTAPVALTSRCARQSSSVVRVERRAPDATPALLTSTSTGPSRSKNASTICLVGDVEPVAADRLDAVPCAANRSATALPMPFVPPVTTTMAAQLERLPVELSGRRLRQVVDEADLARVLVRRELLAHEVLQLLLLERLSGDDVGAGEREAVLLRADDGALDDVRVADQAVLDLGRRDPDPAHLDQVVGAAAVPEEAVVVALEEVAGADAVAVEGLASSSRARPSRGARRCRPSIEQLPVLGELERRSRARARRCFPASRGRGGSRCRCGTASDEPIPSSTSTPNVSSQRSCSSRGSASPADVHKRTGGHVGCLTLGHVLAGRSWRPSAPSSSGR